MNDPITKGINYNEREDIYEYQSHSDYLKTYLVFCGDRNNRINWECTCYDFMYRKAAKNQECKHIIRVKFIDECRLKIDHLMPQNKGLLHDTDG